jgi:DNA repair protein RadD
MIKPRPYQADGIEKIVNFLKNNKKKKPHIYVAPTGAGKSIIIAGVVKQLTTPTLILQPSKEILEQNYTKFINYGGEASIYSASVGKKEIGNITFATLGSIKDKVELFKNIGVQNVIVDEAHTNFPPEKGSMFRKFIDKLNPKSVIGLTATPVRLKQYGDINNAYSQLNFINRGQPTYFKEILDVIPIDLMVKEGYWTPLVYEQYDFDEAKLTLNSTGAEFTEFSIQQSIAEQGVNNNIYLRIKKLLKGNNRHSILVFMDSVENAIKMASFFDDAECVHGKTPLKDRTEIILKLKKGEIRIVTNHSALLIGFDHPQLDTIIMGRPTNSLSQYYQTAGRGVRIHDLKENCLIIDYCNNVKRFGKLEDLNFENIDGYGWGMFSGERLLTDTPLGSPMKTKIDIIQGIHDESLNKGNMRLWFGKFENQRVNDIPLWYLEYVWKEFDFNSKQMNLLKGQIKEILIKNNIKI